MNKEETISIIRSLLSSTKNSYSVSMLCNDFREATGIDMPLYGFKTACDFLQSIPNTVKVSGLYPVQYVQLVKNEKSAHIVSLVSKQKNFSKKNKMRRNSNRGGNFSKTYENRVSENFDSKPPPLETARVHKNFENSNNIEDMESKLQKIKLQPDDKLLDSYSVFSNESKLARHFFPLGEKLPCIDLDLNAKVGEYIEVCLSEINNPNKFYVQLRKFKKKLTQFSSKLQIFYLNNEKFYTVPLNEVKAKDTCVVLMCNSWHRAEIIKVIDDFLVTVLLVDYGIEIKSLKKNLRFLHKFFASLPKQAILASLANIEPEDLSGWSNEATERFFSLAYQRDLIAGVVKINLKTPWLSVALTSAEECVVHINDTLVEEGLARFKNYDSLDGSPLFHNNGELLATRKNNRKRHENKKILLRDYYYSLCGGSSSNSISSSCSSLDLTYYKSRNGRPKEKSCKSVCY